MVTTQLTKPSQGWSKQKKVRKTCKLRLVHFGTLRVGKGGLEWVHTFFKEITSQTNYSLTKVITDLCILLTLYTL